MAKSVLDINVTKNLKKLRKIEREMKIALNEGASLLKMAVEAKAPVGKTGVLKKNIGKTKPKFSQILQKMYVRVGPTTRAWYAHFVEYGFHGGAAQPFLRQTRQGKGEQIKDVTLKLLWSLLERKVHSGG